MLAVKGIKQIISADSIRELRKFGRGPSFSIELPFATTKRFFKLLILCRVAGGWSLFQLTLGERRGASVTGLPHKKH